MASKQRKKLSEESLKRIRIAVSTAQKNRWAKWHAQHKAAAAPKAIAIALHPPEAPRVVESPYSVVVTDLRSRACTLNKIADLLEIATKMTFPKNTT